MKPDRLLLLLEIAERGQSQSSAARAITYDRDTYSPMVEALCPAAARACVVIKDGGKEVCTAHGGAWGVGR
ncbi:hypothetical protein [Streptomyces parvus]|uniref:hypothetical protein n=1 Tax=Streptomyces parvus TaxID=66428 RepID=UPI001EF18B66|nr:hypothetical protein [Streptomyces parvus]